MQLFLSISDYFVTIFKNTLWTKIKNEKQHNMKPKGFWKWRLLQINRETFLFFITFKLYICMSTLSITSKNCIQYISMVSKNYKDWFKVHEQKLEI